MEWKPSTEGSGSVTAHADCDHPNTKAARAACRKMRAGDAPSKPRAVKAPTEPIKETPAPAEPIEETPGPAKLTLIEGKPTQRRGFFRRK